jgi:hypothetical protein
LKRSCCKTSQQKKTTTTATTASDQQQQRFYAIQRPIQKKAKCTELFTASLVAAAEE